MREDKPCCAASAAKRIRKVMIDGKEIGISQLDVIFSSVSAMGLESEEAIGQALIKQVKIYNYAPSSKELAYKQAILNEYVIERNNNEQNRGSGSWLFVVPPS